MLFAFTQSIYASRRECFNLFLRQIKRNPRCASLHVKKDDAADAVASTIRSSHRNGSSQSNKASSKNQPERRGPFRKGGNPYILLNRKLANAQSWQELLETLQQDTKVSQRGAAGTMDIVSFSTSLHRLAKRSSRQLPAEQGCHSR